MSKNVNKRFFAEFLALLALTVDPDPDEEPDDPEICLKQQEIEQYRNGHIDTKSVSSKSGSSSSSGSGSGEEDDSETKGNIFANARKSANTCTNSP